jgi:hypothetical protein
MNRAARVVVVLGTAAFAGRFAASALAARCLPMIDDAVGPIAARLAPRPVSDDRANGDADAPAATGSSSADLRPLAPRPTAPTPRTTPTTNARKAPAEARARHAITRADVEAAVADRMGGASTTLARDEDGQPVGLALHGVSRLARFGVRDGDVLVSANGMPLRTPDEGLRALGALEHAREVTVGFRRGEGSFYVHVAVEDAPVDAAAGAADAH